MQLKTPGFMLDYGEPDAFQISDVFTHDIYGIKNLTKGSVVLDIGANIGLVSLMAAHVGCRVIAVEPDPQTFGRLVKNVEQNKFLNNDSQDLPEGSITCLNLAISAAAQTYAFKSRVDHSGGSYLDIHPQPGSEIPGYFSATGHSGNFNTINVKGVPISYIFDAHQVACCDFLKLDCEGAEWFVFQPENAQLLQNRVRKVAFECHADSDTYYVKFLSDLGYSVYSPNYVIGSVIKARNLAFTEASNARS